MLSKDHSSLADALVLAATPTTKGGQTYLKSLLKVHSACACVVHAKPATATIAANPVQNLFITIPFRSIHDMKKGVRRRRDIPK